MNSHTSDRSNIDNTLTSAREFQLKGNECFKLQLFNKAVYFYSKAIEIDPQSSTLFSNRSQAYLKLHKNEKAYMDASFAIGLDIENQKAYFRRALAELKLGLNDKAVEDLEYCLLLNPKIQDVKSLLCTVKPEQPCADVITIGVFNKDEAIQSRKPLTQIQINEGTLSVFKRNKV